MLDSIVDVGLTPTVETDYQRWRPLHWVLAVPDVMETGGFDALVGNPPFRGGQHITGDLGTNVRNWLVNMLAFGQKGSADIVAYFFLRAIALSASRGTIGLIATNTVAQGDTRQIGLDQMVARGLSITRAIQSKSWPSANVNLEYAAVWGTRSEVACKVPRVSDELIVRRISTLLEPAGRVDGHPMRLAENVGIAFIGCYVLGKGFVLDPEDVAEWIAADPRNAEVLFPYLNGDDLNSRPDSSASRWVVDFNDRSEASAMTYQLPYRRLHERVRPVRLKNNRKVYRDYWWKYAEKRPAMRKAIAELDEFLVMTRHSVTVIPSRVAVGQVPSEALVVFATDSFADQAILSSSLHQMWAIKYGSSLGHNTTRYTPSDVFDTYPRPIYQEGLERAGKTLDADRRKIMMRGDGLGLTKLYNLVNDPEITDSADPDVARLRRIHVELDEAVMAAYGWEDVALEHGFHTYRQMRRWTVSPTARVEILDRLLEENHRRAAAQGEAPPPAEADDDEGEDR